MSFFAGLKSFLTPESKDAVEKGKYDTKKKPVAVSEPTATKIPVPPDVPDVDPKSFIDNREGGTEEKEIIVIKKTVVNIHNVLERNAAIESDSLKKGKKKKKKGILSSLGASMAKGMLSPIKKTGLNIKKFLIKFIGGWLLINLLPHFKKLVGLFKGLASILSWLGGFAKNLLVGLTEIVNVGANVYDWAYNNIEKTFGEDAAKAFEKFTGVFNNLAKLVVVAALISMRMGVMGNILKWGKKLFVKGAAKTAATTLGTAAGTAKTFAIGTAKIGTGAAAGVVAGAGLLASGLGEGAAQLNKWGLKREENWKKKAKEKGWWNPTKYFWAAAAGIMTILNRFFGVLGGLLDIIGAPFRMIIELIRFPFLDEAGKKKQAENLAKFDARIREQFRKGINAIDFLGVISDDKGSWGSLYGEKGTDAMGYTKDGKSVDKKTRYDKIIAAGGEIKDYGNVGGERIIAINYPDKKVGGFLGIGGKTKKRSTTISSSDLTSSVEDIINKSRQSNLDLGKNKQKDKKGAIIGGLLGATAGPLGAVAGAAIGNTIQERGLKGTVGGVADFLTGGIWDFDKKNRKGAPKDWGMRRMAGGVADWATMGITDFDKRGKGNLQFDPMFGGKDKAWGSRNEQAKRKEKQSGMGIKRGIGGALDFATLGTFDFDKQNPTGSPKDWGLLRMMGGITDAMTGGLTDFDKRGRGILQVNPLSGGRDRRWGKEVQRPSRSRRGLGFSEYYPIDQPRVNNYAEMQEYIKNNPEAKGGTWTQVGDQWVLLTPKQVKERNDKLIKAAEGGSKYAQSLLDFDGIKPKNDVSLKSNNISEYPSYDDEGDVVTMIQPIIMEKSGKTQVIPVNSGSSGSSSGVNSNDTQHLRAGAA